MLSLLSVLRKDRFTPRFYIAAATDNMSLQKARSFEDSVAEKPAVMEASSLFMQIYRSREVGQSYVTSVWTTIVYSSRSVANDPDQATSDSLQWSWDLHSSVCDRFLVQGAGN